MFGIVVFVLALAAVFALKALSIVKTYDATVSKSTAFSWLSAQAQDTRLAEQAEQQVAAKSSARVHVLRRRPHAA